MSAIDDIKLFLKKNEDKLKKHSGSPEIVEGMFRLKTMAGIP